MTGTGTTPPPRSVHGRRSAPGTTTAPRPGPGIATRRRSRTPPGPPGRTPAQPARQDLRPAHRHDHRPAPPGTVTVPVT